MEIHLSKILLVEDDSVLAESVVALLELDGHRVEAIEDGNESLRLLEFSSFDLIILDWELPGRIGPDICRSYRHKGGKAPVLMLTQRSAVLDKVSGLDAGADDYLPKPFDPSEFRARVRALLRRSAALFDPPSTKGRITLNHDGASTVGIDGDVIKLHPREFELLEFLFRHPTSYFTPEQLLKHIWSSDSEVSQEAIRVCIMRLRKKIDQPGRPSVIENSKGWGYKISDTYLQ